MYSECMTCKEKATTYVQSQKSLHLYPRVQDAFEEVLCSLSEAELDWVCGNLELMVLHEQAVAQVMHFDPKKAAFAVMQFTFYDDMPGEVLRWVIAHELGHAMQKRNWREGDGTGLEEDADICAEQWGYLKTKEIEEYLRKRREN